jgi:hypothetical protein
MLEMIYFTFAGLGLYFVSDSILNQLEIRRGERFVHRDLIFFAIILISAIVTFSLIQYLLQE